MISYDRRTRLHPLPDHLDVDAVKLPPGWAERRDPPPARRPGDPPRLHLAIPHDLPDHDQERREPVEIVVRARSDAARRLDVADCIERWATRICLVAFGAVAALALVGCAAAPDPRPPAAEETIPADEVHYAALRVLGRNLAPPSLGPASFEQFGLPPERRACLRWLTPERAQGLMDWVAAEMGVASAAPPPAVCATADELEVVYRALGAPAHKPRLGAYLAVPPLVLINRERTEPENAEHIVVHEYCHDLQWRAGRAGEDHDALQDECVAVHTAWLEREAS